MKLIAAALIVVLAGCATKPITWNKPGASSQEFAQVKYQCLQETQSAGNYSAFGPPIFVAAAASGARKRQFGMFSACMEANGWYRE